MEYKETDSYLLCKNDQWSQFESTNMIYQVIINSKLMVQTNQAKKKLEDLFGCAGIK